MERKFLEGLKVGEENLPKELIDSIMAEYGKSFKDKDEKIQSLTTEKEGLSTQLSDMNKKVKELSSVDADKLKEEIQNLNTKYETDTKALNDKLTKQNYDFTIKELSSGLKFSSESAKKAFLADLSAKDLKIEDGKVLEFDDFVKSYKESDPNAFEKEAEPGVTTNTGDSHEGNPEADDAFVNKVMGIK